MDANYFMNGCYFYRIICLFSAKNPDLIWHLHTFRRSVVREERQRAKYVVFDVMCLIDVNVRSKTVYVL